MVDITYTYAEDEAERIRQVLAKDRVREYWRAKVLEYDDLKNYPPAAQPIPRYAKPLSQPALKKSYAFLKEIYQSLQP